MSEDEPMKQPLDAGLADPGERNSIFRVLDSFRQYRKQTHYSTTHRRRQNFYALPDAHQRLLKQPPIDILTTLSDIDDAVDDNADVADAILEVALGAFELSENPEPGSQMYWHDTAQSLDLSKAHSTLRQFWRDWSEEGFRMEIRPVLDLILLDLRQVMGQDVEPDATLLSYRDVLLPGAGLGRLVFELSLLGYNAEGNEISYHQLFASQFILNNIERAGQYKLYPFVSSFNNNIARSRQLHNVMVPDVHPGTVLSERMQMADSDSGIEHPGRMSMTAGDFISSYSSTDNEAAFDVVVTLYFIDTAPNVVRYLETIYHCLREGGVWINIGPLLWHFEDSTHPADDDETDKNGIRSSVTTGIAEPGSVELSEEEVLQLARWIGFEVILRAEPIAGVGGYIRDSESLMNSSYKCCHWVLRKKSQASCSKSGWA